MKDADLARYDEHRLLYLKFALNHLPAPEIRLNPIRRRQ